MDQLLVGFAVVTVGLFFGWLFFGRPRKRVKAAVVAGFVVVGIAVVAGVEAMGHEQCRKVVHGLGMRYSGGWITLPCLDLMVMGLAGLLVIFDLQAAITLLVPARREPSG